MKSKLNEQIKTGLNYATGVLFDLDDVGVTVYDIEIDGGKPVIMVDRIPDEATPAHLLHVPVGRNVCKVQVALYRGCRLQCESLAPRVAKKVAA